MNLVIDIGNTRTKVFVFKGERSVSETSYQSLTVQDLRKVFTKYPIKASILSSVVARKTGVIAFLKNNSAFIELNAATPLPIKNRYKTPATLGNDRIANAAGAAKIFSGKNCLVIDCGTCIKYDFVNSQNEYMGGAISPGLLMRYAALHKFTALLPRVKPSADVKMTGSTTNESIVSGVQLGMLNEMDGYILRYRKKYKNLKVILSGGDASCFAHLLNFPIFAAPKLTSTGLNEILQYNIPKK
jgi:type III pantothenate kinase